MLSLVHEERFYDPKSSILPCADDLSSSMDDAFVNTNTKKRARSSSSSDEDDNNSLSALAESPSKVYKAESGPIAAIATTNQDTTSQQATTPKRLVVRFVFRPPTAMTTSLAANMASAQ
jgi:hypothetical protein